MGTVTLPDAELVPFLDVKAPNPQILQESLGWENIQSVAVDITLSIEGEKIPLPGPAQICLSLQSKQAIKPEDLCLGYVDESVRPLVWKCEDYCLSSANADVLCGKSDHFTSFAILLMGTQEKKNKKDAKENNEGSCGQSDSSIENGYNTITGSLKGDSILTVSSIIMVFSIVALIGLFLFATPMGRKCVLGKEGYRLYELRARRAQAI